MASHARDRTSSVAAADLSLVIVIQLLDVLCTDALQKMRKVTRKCLFTLCDSDHVSDAKIDRFSQRISLRNG